MAGAVMHHDDHDDHDEWNPPKGEALAERLFGLGMAGLFAVIFFMVLMGGWGSGA